jgi:CRISPR-associated protein Cmr6
MNQSANPQYLKTAAISGAQLSPQQKFNQFSNIWQEDWSLITGSKQEALKHVCTLSDSSKNLMKALAERARSLLPPDSCTQTFYAKAIAPFATGLGLQHPLANGFAFISPYGLPYLAGSGVKGVLRQAARELATDQWSSESEWNLNTIDYLFGNESSDDSISKLSRGALTFFDVIPTLAGDRLCVEVMTPHQSHYYQDGETPHDSGSPNPIFFLAVPADSQFSFRVRCDIARLTQYAPDLVLNGKWEQLLGEAFIHAFNWLGFGAKTAVGYGAMAIDDKEQAKVREAKELAEAKIKHEEAVAQREQTRLTMTPEARVIDELLTNRPDKNWSDLTTLFKALDKKTVSTEYVLPVAEHLQELMTKAKKWKEKTDKKNPEKDNEFQETLKVKKWLTRP